MAHEVAKKIAAGKRSIGRTNDSAEATRIIQRSYVTVALRSPVLAGLPWLVHGFSTRLGGVSAPPGAPRDSFQRVPALSLARMPWDAAANVEENRRRFLSCLGAPEMELVLQHQIHSDLIRVVEHSLGGKHLPRGDGLVTTRPGLLLSIISADCVPILLADARQRVVAAVHCGWRGTLRRLAQKAVGLLRMCFGSRCEDLRAAIGPGIGSCCYEVGEEVAAEFESQFVYAEKLLQILPMRQTNADRKYAVVFRSPFRPLPKRTGRSVRLDLGEANIRQLQDAGLTREQISAGLPCACCHPELFFSHRRDGAIAGRMLSVIGIRER